MRFFVFLDCWIGNLTFSLSQNRYHKELGLFFDLRDTLHLRSLCTPIKPPPGPVCIWGGAPQSVYLDLLDRVQSRLINLIGPVIN